MVITSSCGSNYLGLIRDNYALSLRFRMVMLEILKHSKVNIWVLADGEHDIKKKLGIWWKLFFSTSKTLLNRKIFTFIHDFEG